MKVYAFSYAYNELGRAAVDNCSKLVVLLARVASVDSVEHDPPAFVILVPAMVMKKFTPYR